MSHAVIAAKETMMIITTERTGTPAATVTAHQKPAKKANVRKRAAHVAAAKPKAGKNANRQKKAATSRTKEKAAKTKVCEGSKTARILELLKRPDGASTKELMNATGWQAHSVRGFISGTVQKRMGLTLTSLKGDDGERRYSVKG